MDSAMGSILKNLSRSQGTSGLEPKPSEQRRPLSFESFEDVAGYLTRKGWTEVEAGEDFFTCIKAFNRAMSFKPPQRKVGLIITGAYGCGKTMFVDSLPLPMKKIDLTIPETVEWIDGQGGYASSIEEMCECNILLDDLGAENIKNEYGVKRDIAGEFICRYHTRGKGRLFITTNLTGEQLLDKYGGRVVDRLKQMCVPVRMTGNSKRKWL